MKEGYIVWNESTAESEFFGIYRSYEKALRQLRKVLRNRFGRCPHQEDKVWDFVSEISDEDSYKITPFEEYDGKWEEA